MAEKEKILVVDDEPSIRKYLQTLLEVDGYDVETVPGGKEALEKVGAGLRPHFIILDVLMPEIDGLETLRQLMQVDRTLNVIMLSCSNEVTTVVEAIRLGALDYLTKPFEKPELDAAFLKCRQKQQLRSENKALREYCEALTEDLSFLAASPQTDSADCSRGRPCIYQWGKRSGQGSSGAHDSPSLHSSRSGVCKGELRRAPRRTA
jgi:two-component system response regulator AtoC